MPALCAGENPPAPPRGPWANRGHVARGGAALPHPSCKRARKRFRFRKKSWYPTWDSNPEKRASEARAYADSASGAFWSRQSSECRDRKARSVKATKSPGTLRRTRAWETASDYVIARRSPPLGARAYPPRKARWAFVARVVDACSSKFGSYIRSPNAVLAAALTLQKQKARSARAVRASDGRKALTRSSSPDRRLYKVASVASCACASGRAL
jgi:hypothetical protein